MLQLLALLKIPDNLNKHIMKKVIESYLLPVCVNERKIINN